MDEEDISWLAGDSSTKKIVQKQVILFAAKIEMESIPKVTFDSAS